MARGPKKHLKRLNAPKHWMLDKMGGTWAPRPSAGPRKLRECLPLILIIRNRLRYALNAPETTKVLMQRLVKVNGVVRTDPKYPVGFMDVISIEKTNENFRLLYDTKGRFQLQRIKADEAKFVLTRVLKLTTGSHNVPYLHTDDGHTHRFPNPDIKRNDTVKVDLATGKIVAHIPFALHNLCMIVGGHNTGRVGVIANIEKHPGSFDIVHIQDSVGHNFATRLSNVFIIGQGPTTYVSLLPGKGVRRSVIDERAVQLKNRGEKIEVEDN